MTYAQKLRDPRWQKKRLQILERDQWMCCCCKSDTRNLQVHHLYYAKRDPWDYPSEAYQTLCGECHEYRQRIIDHWTNQIRILCADIPNDRLSPVLHSAFDDVFAHWKGPAETIKSGGAK